MKTSVITFFCALPVLSFCQSTLTPHNPAPRVGQEIEITISIQKEDLAPLDSKEPRTPAEEKRLIENHIAGGNLRFTRTPQDTGAFTIGPLALTYDGTTYTTDKLVLQVSPALPANVTDGIWLRCVTHREHQYLIIEQRIANRWKKEDDGKSITLSTEEVTFTEFQREKFEGKGLEIISSSSATRNEPVDMAGGQGSGTSAYKISIYKFEHTPMFKGPFTMDKKFFTNIPKGIVLPEVTIP